MTLARFNFQSGHLKSVKVLRSAPLILICACSCLARKVEAQSTTVPASIDQNINLSGRRPLYTPPSVTPIPDDFATARLVPGFLLQMEVYNSPEMNMTLRVDERGNLNIPLVGAIHVAGDSLTEAESAVAKGIAAAEILLNPQVTLNVLQYTSSSITVLGEVQTPGRLPVLAPKNLADVLAMAGGETISAGNEIEVRHSSASSSDIERIQYAQGSSPDPLRAHIVSPGDTVFVRRAGVIYVLGAVNRPGGYFMVDGGKLNVLQAISLAYGTTLVSSLRSLRLIRPTGDGRFTELPVPYDKITKGQAPMVTLEAQDILYVPTSATKNILINGSAIIGTAASAAIYKAP